MSPQYTREELDRAEQLLEIVERGRKSGRMPQFKATGYKHDPTLSTTTPPYSHGNGGLFSTPGQQPTMFATVVHPMQSVANALPVQPQGSATPDDPSYGGYTSPLYTTITGFTDEGTVTEPVDICDDQPTGGLLKACTLTAPYGRIGRGFRMDIDTIGQLVNRGEPTDLQVVNPLLSDSAPFQIPTGTGSGIGTAINLEFRKRLMIAANNLQQRMAPLTWDGTPANNSANGGYMEFQGLNTFIATGNKVDAIDGTPCPSMDSDIKNFGYDLVNGSGRDIVQYVDMMAHFLATNARTMGLEPVQWAIAMRPELFDEISKIWPVRYYQEALLQMANFTSGRITIAANETTNFRDEMRNGQFLPIRGQRYPVLLDHAITEDNNITKAELGLGQYASSIYFIPMMVMNGIPVTYWEYFNQANGQARELERLGRASHTWTTDSGMFRWFSRERNGCFEWDFITKPRIIMRTPFLAGRIQNVAYEPLQHTRMPFPDDAYFVNGGRTNAPTSSFYLEYDNTTPIVMGGGGSN